MVEQDKHTNQVTLSLTMRVKMFRAQGKAYSVYRLRKLYARHDVKFKQLLFKDHWVCGQESCYCEAEKLAHLNRP